MKAGPAPAKFKSDPPDFGKLTLLLDRSKNDPCPTQPHRSDQARTIYMDCDHAVADRAHPAMATKFLVDNRCDGFDRRGQFSMSTFQLPGQIGDEPPDPFGPIRPRTIPRHPM